MTAVVCWVVAHPVQTILYVGIVAAQLGAAWTLRRLRRPVPYPEMQRFEAFREAMES